jgi:hypothetical protein
VVWALLAWCVALPFQIEASRIELWVSMFIPLSFLIGYFLKLPVDHAHLMTR